jgi:hypothetical protein
MTARNGSGTTSEVIAKLNEMENACIAAWAGGRAPLHCAVIGRPRPCVLRAECCPIVELRSGEIVRVFERLLDWETATLRQLRPADFGGGAS